MNALFPTITDAAWARGLAAARARRAPEAVRSRVFAGPACPVCGWPGLHRELTGGTEITHGGGSGERCWWPSASASYVSVGGPRLTLGKAEKRKREKAETRTMFGEVAA